MDQHAPLEYLVGHLEDSLARDPRVAEQGLHVAVSDERSTVTVTGTVTEARRQAAITEVIRDHLQGWPFETRPPLLTIPSPTRWRK